MRRILELGGIVAGVVLVGFGVGVIVIAIQGRNTVGSELQRQHIVGTDDMTPSAIRGEAEKAGLADVSLPSCSVAGQQVDTGGEARCFAEYMRIHALEATGGKTYAELPQYATADGRGTNDPQQAQQQNGRPVSNPVRNVWITETALSTALNMSYMASQLALFSLVTGVALLLTGIGFLVLTARGALRH